MKISFIGQSGQRQEANVPNFQGFLTLINASEPQTIHLDLSIENNGGETLDFLMKIIEFNQRLEIKTVINSEVEINFEDGEKIDKGAVIKKEKYEATVKKELSGLPLETVIIDVEKNINDNRNVEYTLNGKSIAKIGKHFRDKELDGFEKLCIEIKNEKEIIEHRKNIEKYKEKLEKLAGLKLEMIPAESVSFLEKEYKGVDKLYKNIKTETRKIKEKTIDEKDAPEDVVELIKEYIEKELEKIQEGESNLPRHVVRKLWKSVHKYLEKRKTTEENKIEYKNFCEKTYEIGTNTKSIEKLEKRIDFFKREVEMLTMENKFWQEEIKQKKIEIQGHEKRGNFDKMMETIIVRNKIDEAIEKNTMGIESLSEIIKEDELKKEKIKDIEKKQEKETEKIEESDDKIEEKDEK
jgi:hypothetical protein